MMDRENNNHFFSIIIPAHNAEGHIRILLNSIREQTFTDYEIIVVCDSCTDRTEEIAKEYGAITERVQFGRDGLTRDRGLELVSGLWVLFADDDDWFCTPDVFQTLADFIRTQGTETDMVAFGYECRGKGTIPPARQNVFVPRIDHVWSSCWRADTIGPSRFGDAVFCSDTYFLKAMKPRIHHLKILDVPIYYYNFRRPGSQTDLFCRGIIHQSPVAE